MTEKQKSEIVRMRTEGITISRIAEVLGISKNTVKTFCRRNKITVRAENKQDNTKCCLNCGKAITQAKNKKTMKFCSSECRVKWWNSHPEAVKRKAIYSFVCPCCGKQFTAYGNKNRKYCSHKCYINARFKGGALNG